MNLLRAEFARLLSRRFVQVMVLLLALAFGITVFTVMASSDMPGDEAWAVAEQQAAGERENIIELRNTCLLAAEPDAPSDLKGKFEGVDCRQFSPANVRTENFLYGTFVFKSSIKPLIAFLTAYLCFFGFLVGASFIGAEMRSGAMVNLLLWRPRRLRVLGAKLGVLLSALAVFFTAFSGVYIATFYGIAETTGWVGELGPRFWPEVTGMTLKAIGISLLAGVAAFAIATLSRHTVAALGTLIGYFVVWEGGARIVMEAVDARPNDQYFLSTHLFTLMDGRYVIYGWNCAQCSYTIYWWQSGLLFLGLAAAFAAAAFAVFRRRDLI